MNLNRKENIKYYLYCLKYNYAHSHVVLKDLHNRWGKSYIDRFLSLYFSMFNTEPKFFQKGELIFVWTGNKDNSHMKLYRSYWPKRRD